MLVVLLFILFFILCSDVKSDSGLHLTGGESVSKVWPVDDRKKKLYRVVVITAMAEEGEPFVKAANLQRTHSTAFAENSPFRLYTGVVNDIEVYLVWPGRDSKYGGNNVGTAAAAVISYISLKFKPDLVISMGTAGGFKSKGAEIGKIYISDCIVFHDRRIPMGDGIFEEQGYGRYPSADVKGLAKNIGAELVIVSTGDSLDCPESDRKILESEGATVKDMEAAAIAWVCHTYDVPFFGLKSITDIVDGDKTTLNEFLSNLSKASANLQGKLMEVLKYLSDNPKDRPVLDNKNCDKYKKKK